MNHTIGFVELIQVATNQSIAFISCSWVEVNDHALAGIFYLYIEAQQGFDTICTNGGAYACIRYGTSFD